MMIMFTTIGAKDVVLLSTPCTKLLGGGSWGHKSRKQKEARGAKFARRSPPYLDRERAE